MTNSGGHVFPMFRRRTIKWRQRTEMPKAVDLGVKHQTYQSFRP